MFSDLLKYLIIITIGITIGYFIGKYVFHNKIYVGPNSKDIVGKTFTDDNNKKYTLEPKIVICPINYQKKIEENKNKKI